MKQSIPSTANPVQPFIDWLDRVLLRPHPSLDDIALQKKSWLLSAFLLILFCIFAGVDITYLITVPGYVPPWYGYIFLIAAYILNRLGKYRLAASLTILMFPLVVFTSLGGGSSANPTATLYYLVLSLILGEILLQKRVLALLTFCNIIGILLMPRIVPASFPDFNSIIGPLATITTGAGLVLISMFHHAQIEKDRQTELRRNEERLRLALDSARMGTWDWSIKTNQVKWSPNVEPIFGLGEGEFTGTFEAYLGLVHPEDLQDVQEKIAKAVSGEIQDYEVEHRIIDTDGSIRWVEGKGKMYRNAGGTPVRMSGTVTDVTPRKQYEQEREKLIRELEANNAELERFTYTVSHDLKSPLVTITGYLGFLEDGMQRGDTSRVKSDILRIQDAANNMKRLLDELLELSRVGRLMNPPEDVSFEELVREALTIVHGHIEEHGVTVIFQPGLPTVYGDRQRLLEVLQNLIDNAAKFMGEQPEPRIEIGQRGEEDGMPVFYVKDNGIGIAPEYHERIFGLFDRLNPKIPGTGTGLAIVKRIVEVHGGRIWVESEAGDGAAFYFTLAKKESNF